MSEVLMSIKPEFAEKIFYGNKKFEFRKTIFKNTNVHKVIVYASSPIQRIIGEFEITDILNDDVEKIWDITADYSGITKDYYMSYFSNKKKAYAIKIGKTKLYKEVRNLSDYNLKVAPQSFAYIK